jgi:hypothetical protein
MMTSVARGWFGLVTTASAIDPRVDMVTASRAPRMLLLGGGSIGFSTTSSAVMNSMNGFVDAYYSRNGIDWVCEAVDFIATFSLIVMLTGASKLPGGGRQQCAKPVLIADMGTDHYPWFHRLPRCLGNDSAALRL